MKAIILLITLIMTQFVIAARNCELYIPDEWPDSRYTIEVVSGNHVVTDNKTGLMWKKCSEGLTDANCSTGSITTHTWQQALDLASTTEFAGFSDWRLPNIEELRSIAAINCYEPSNNETVFPNTSSNLFWSSSPVVNNDIEAWVVNFNFGNDGDENRVNSHHVRLVRSGQ
ncbi:MAG: DUF1566 domain-containing protein [Proteobacteria bacterium]|nr:MAG: DUF1566 domain-containing protein [Pseudomonadota bacterium]